MVGRSNRRARTGVFAALGLGAGLIFAAGAALTVQAASPTPAAGSSAACPTDNGGITLPPGFCATVFADNLGHLRHLTVAPNGVVYANIWSGTYYAGSKPPEDGFLVALQDSDGDGRADVVKRFGETAADGARGGTGIAVYRGAVYAEVNDRIVRYALTPGSIAPAGKPEVVLSGLPLTGDHPMHPFVIDAKGELFVDLGSATNSCQPRNRVAGVPGAAPCVETETRAGLWRYDANKRGQVFSAKERFVAGIRNGEGLGFDAAGRMFATQHGRDQLLQNWPALYPDAARATELPSEELLLIQPGADYGWPTCYFDGAQNRLVLAPEYGGDGGKAVGVCARKRAPVAAFPAHWAPNSMAIYNAAQFPVAYRGGAFIAFHGSWNRAPAPQDGYNVVFQPLRDGKAAGRYTTFADGFAGAAKNPGQAAFRPMGLAVGPDGALYISDDVHGRIWRVTYRGGAVSSAAAAAAPPPAQHVAATPAAPAVTATLMLPPGVTAAQVELGGRIFRGEASGGTCAGCHGADAKGSPLAPDLTAGTWMWGDGSLAAITETTAKGVPNPKRYRNAMPPLGGAPLSTDDLAAVAAYVWAVGHTPK